MYVCMRVRLSRDKTVMGGGGGIFSKDNVRQITCQNGRCGSLTPIVPFVAG
jgi:hypothetical protein